MLFLEKFWLNSQKLVTLVISSSHVKSIDRKSNIVYDRYRVKKHMKKKENFE
nr:MAG TPA: hypothetical protein [Caudoviricetes sp.]